MKPKLTACSIFLFLLMMFFNPNLRSQNDCRVLLYQISENYEGDCKNGFAHGKGKAFGIDSYEGKFKKGLPHGYGVYKWKNGNIYEGDWREGERNGKGTLYSAVNNEKITGYWRDNEFVKEIKEAEYHIVEKYNVQSVTVRKIGNISNKVTVKLRRDGQFKSNQMDMNIAVSSGILSKSQYFIYNSTVFPWKGTITFSLIPRLSPYPVRCKVVVEIDKPGEWEVLIDY